MSEQTPAAGDEPGDVPISDVWQERLALLAARPGFDPTRLAAVVGAAVVAVVVAVVVLRGPEPPPPELSLPLAATAPAAPETTTTTAAPSLVVHAAGAVSTPGVYTLDAGGRVADLLDVAGGASPDADLSRLNLAAALVDGQRVYVPRPGEVVPPVEGGGAPAVAGGTNGGAATGTEPGPIDLNAATAAQLEELPGVGPATSAAIIAERDRRGRFASVDDLLDVRGIGEAKLAGLRDLVVVS